MEVYYGIVFFIFGLIFGSFYNVVGYRVPLKMSIISPSSHCPKCNHKLTALELIPVFSYLIQGGKCKKCGKKIPIFYPMFELITGLLFLLTYIIFGISIDTVIGLIFVSLILILIISDILYMHVPNILLIIFGLPIFIIKVALNGLNSIPVLLLNMFIPFIVLYIFKIFGDFIFKKESLGTGDINLMLIFGLVLGWKISLVSIFIASLLGLIGSLISLKNNNSHELPFVPYLGLSSFICLFARVYIVAILEFLGF